MSSHNSTIVVDPQLSSYFTPSIDNSSLGMDHTLNNSFPSSSVMHVEIMFSSVPQEKIIQIHEELANLQNQISTENISTTAILTIYNIHLMIETEGVDKMHLT